MWWMLLSGCALTFPERDDSGFCTPVSVWLDQDGDGFGGEPLEACPGELPPDIAEQGGDCDDSDPSVHPDAAEICDGEDQDCDGLPDVGLAFDTWYADEDGDGWGDPETTRELCGPSEGWVDRDQDCDDADASVHPEAQELCNGIDDDCDGEVDGPSALEFGDWYVDDDGDGWGDAFLLEGCPPESGAADQTGDCDESAPSVHPEAAETCLDLVDQNCNGLEDDWSGECDLGSYESVAGGFCSGVAADASLCADGVAAIVGGSAYGSVADALYAATSGDTVSICPGVHNEDLSVTKDLTLIGYGAGVSVLGPGDERFAILTVSSAVSLTLLDLSVEGGPGGGLEGSFLDLCIADVEFNDNSTNLQGGAMELGGVGTLQMENVSFDGNSTEWYGGAIHATKYAFEVLDCSFTNNSSGWSGGAIEVNANSSGTLWGTVFQGNSAEYSAGAIEVSGTSSLSGDTLLLDSCELSGNHAGYTGGAVHMNSGSTPTLIGVDTLFQGNDADYEGGAVSISGSDVNHFGCVGCTFTGNSSEYEGGAFDLSWLGEPHLTLVECEVSDNSSRSGAGFHDAGGDAVGNVLYTSILRNVATDGDGGAEVEGLWSFVDTDWGSDDSDNSPTDINGQSGLGSGESFTCSGGAC